MLHYKTHTIMRRREGIESVPFIGYIDTLCAIVLVFVVITAFTAIAFTLSKKAMFDAQRAADKLQAELQQYQERLQVAQRETRELRAELQQYQERLQVAGYQNIQEIPNRIEWRDAVLTKQVLENTDWAERVVELPMYEEWQQVRQFNAKALRNKDAKFFFFPSASWRLCVKS